MVIVLTFFSLRDVRSQDKMYQFEHFSLNVPNQFSIDTSGLLKTVCILSAPALPNDLFVENIMITRQTGFYRELSLEEYKTRAERTLQQITDVTLLTSEIMPLAHHSVYHLTYLYKSKTGDQKIESFAFKNTYLIYLLTYTADIPDYDRWRSAVQTIAEGFTWHD